jgi:hypothetical protein
MQVVCSSFIEKVVISWHGNSPWRGRGLKKVVTSLVDAEHTSGRLDPCAMDAKRDARYARITAHI